MRLELKNPEGSKTTTTTNNDISDTPKDTAEPENGKDEKDFDIGPPLEVWFPYDRIYPEQYRFLQCVKRALYKKGHALIEAPPGTNQSLCLSCLLTSYQQQQQQLMSESIPSTPRRKIIYATNSVPETLKVIRELAVAMEYRQQQQQHEQPQSNGNKKRKKRPQQHDALFQNVQDGFWKSTATMSEETKDATTAARIQTYNETHAHRDDALPFLAICLKGSDREMIDRACRNRRQGKENQSPPPATPVNGIFTSLQHLHEWVLGTNANANATSPWSCPQELTDYAIRHANVLVVTYPYLLDPMTAMMIGSAIYDGPQPHETSNSKETPSHDKTQTTPSEPPATNNESSSSSSSDAIVVFDHAHNIDAACNDALSATVHLHDLEQATRSLDKLSSEIARYKQQQQKHSRRSSETSTAMDIDTMDTTMEDATSMPQTPVPAPLQTEYESLVQQPMDAGMYRPILFPSSDVVTEPVPGNIRHAKHFVGCLKKIVEHFKSRLKLATDEVSFKKHQQKQHQKEGGGGSSVKKKKMSTGSQSPLAFLHQMMNATALDSKTLRFVHFRVVTLLRTLGLSHESFFAGLLNVAYLASLLGFTNTLESTKFAIVLEQSSVVIGHHSSPTLPSTAAAIDAGRKTEYVMMLQVACLDPSLAMRPILDRFDTVILTSSTLSPLPFYPKILQFEPVVAESIPMTTIRPCINPIMISRGSDQLTMSTSYKERFTMGCIRNYGKMLVDLVSSIPDGVVVYFPSYNYMEALICEWDATGIMREMTEWKLVFVETKDNRELNAIALDNYRASCDIGRGGIFFSVARGSISEAVPFDLHYGRAVVMIGIPYEYTLSKVVQARLEYIQTHCDIREQDYLTFDAVRQVAKCFGRVVRSKTDYGVLIFADNRFHRNDKKTKLPGWVTQFLPETQQDLTTDSAVAQIQRFLRQTGQPVDQSLLQTVLTTTQDS